jgi:hypothetical protein
MGQKRTLGCARAMSAIPPKADIAKRRCDVRFVPKADITSGLIDYFIGAAEQRRRHGEAEHSGSLRIDDQQKQTCVRDRDQDRTFGDVCVTSAIARPEFDRQKEVQ